MPLSLPRHPREKVGRLQIQEWRLAHITNYEAAVEHQNPEGPTFFFFFTYPALPIIILITMPTLFHHFS